METLERSRVCRLCGKHAGTAIDIFDKRGDHVKRINSVLPILVHEMDLLPKHICHPCDRKLQDFHKFYEDCLRTDASLKGQLSWMRGPLDREDIGFPMVQISNLMIKTEPPERDDDGEDENFANYVENNCALYPPKIFASSGGKCSHCGSHRVESPNDEKPAIIAAKKTRAVGRNNVERNNNKEFASRDSIRRNLFATEIFDDESPRLRREIPCRDNRDESARLERLECRQDGGRAAGGRKMAAGVDKMAARTLRPRKIGATLIPAAPTAPEVPAKPRNRSRSKNNDASDANVVKSVAIKVEASEKFERSLRPRVSGIDYSDTRRKNPLARTIGGNKRKKTFEDSAPPAKVRPTGDDESVARANFVRVKVEPRESLETTSHPKIRETGKEKIAKANLRGSKIAKTNFHGSKIPDVDPTTAKSSNPTGRRLSPAKSPAKASPYLRSQRVQLRSGKLRTFESVAEKPKRIQSGILLRSIKLEDARSKRAIFKHRDCEICRRRFASAELYMLHDCYSINRH